MPTHKPTSPKQTKIAQAVKGLKTKSAKDYFLLFRAMFLNQGVGVLRGFLVAKFLGPADFGLVSSVRLISMFEKFGKMGLVPVVNREVSHLQGEGNLEPINKIKSTGYTSEVWLSIILAFIGVCSSFFVSDLKISVAIAITSATLIFTKIQTTLVAESILCKKLELYAKVNLWTGLTGSCLIMAGVPWGGVWWVLTIPMLQAIASILWYKLHVKFYFSWHIDRLEFVRQFKVAIPIAFQNLSYGTYRYAEEI